MTCVTNISNPMGNRNQQLQARIYDKEPFDSACVSARHKRICVQLQRHSDREQWASQHRLEWRPLDRNAGLHRTGRNFTAVHASAL